MNKLAIANTLFPDRLRKTISKTALRRTGSNADGLFFITKLHVTDEHHSSLHVSGVF